MTRQLILICMASLAAGVLLRLSAGSAAAPATLPAGVPLITQPVEQLPFMAGRAHPATREVVPVSGQPFAKAVRVQVAQREENPWDIAFRCPTALPIEKGDVLLASVTLRAVDPLPDVGEATAIVVVEQSTKPWRKFAIYPAIVGREWRKFDVPVVCGEKAAAGAANLVLQLGVGRQTLEIGQISLVNYGRNMPVDHLPRTPQRYAGQALDAPWRKEAAARIERYRKADLTVVATDASGHPLADVPVTVVMKRHAFAFGTAVNSIPLFGNDANAQNYRQCLLHLFTRATVENDMKWPEWQANRKPALAVVQWLREHGIEVRGHTLVWPGRHWLPEDVQKLKGNGPALKQRVAEHIADELGAFKGQCVEWDVLNEPFWNHIVQDAAGPEVAVEWFKQAKALDPSARMFFNEYPVPQPRDYTTAHNDHFEKTARYLLSNKAPVEGLGIQCHFQQNLSPPHILYRGFDRFAELGLPIEVTEFDIDIQDEDLQGQYTRDFMTIVFSHPAIEGLICWGFWEGFHWKPAGAMFRKDWSVKPNGRAWMDLVFKQWWTREQGKTDASGRYVVRAFKGEYEIAAGAGPAAVNVKTSLGKDGKTVEVRIGK